MADGTAPHGRNMTDELTSDERGALFHDHFGKLCEVEDEIALLNEQKKKLKRLAKNDGFASDDISWALRARKMEDTTLVVDALRRRVEIAGWLHFMPKGFQADLFDTEDRTEEERAYGKGSVAAAFNRRPSPEVGGYDTGSAEGQAWMRGFNSEADAREEHLASARAKLGEAMLAADAGPAAEGAGGATGGEDEGPPAQSPTYAGRKKTKASSKHH